MTDSTHAWLYDYAMSFVGTRYSWGGSSPMSGFDCSGFCVELLEAAGIIDHDMSAQGLHDFLDKTGIHDVRDFGSLVFFGNTATTIRHMGFCLDNEFMLEAGGGGSKTVTISDAIRDQAFIRVRPISRRLDLVAAIMPHYL